MTHVLHRNGVGGFPEAVGGEGCYLIDSTGRRYLDGCGGAAVSCLGHGHPDVIKAITRQMERMAYAHTNFFTNRPMEELADLLVQSAPAGLGKAYFVSGGSEAVETAFKLARQYFVDKGEPQRRHFIGRRQGFHGNTLGALAIGGSTRRRALYDPLLVASTHVSPCYAYRERGAGESEEQYADRLARELEDAIGKLGPDTVIAFVAEPVVGATLGAVPAVPGYFRKVREICDAHGILLILDEVMCGMGRTGTLHASEQEDVRPDLVVLGKSLGGGYQPVGATLVSTAICDVIAAGTGAFQHGHTYVGHATVCAAALSVQQIIRDQDLLSNVRARGDQLFAELRAALKDNPYVGDIRGRGLLLGIEVVADRATKRPLDRRLKAYARIQAEAMRQGLMCYGMGGTVDGQDGDHVLLAPPYIIDSSQITELVDKFTDTMHAVQRSLAADGG